MLLQRGCRLSRTGGEPVGRVDLAFVGCSCSGRPRDGGWELLKGRGCESVKGRGCALIDALETGAGSF